MKNDKPLLMNNGGFQSNLIVSHLKCSNTSISLSRRQQQMNWQNISIFKEQKGKVLNHTPIRSDVARSDFDSTDNQLIQSF